MTLTRHELIVPDLGLPDVPLVASVWFKQTGDEVIEGESLLEVAAGEVVVDLPAPGNGVLIEQKVEEEELLETGQLLAIIRGN